MNHNDHDRRNEQLAEMLRNRVRPVTPAMSTDPIQNTHKVRAFAASVASGFVYFVNWLATVPPEQQAGWLAELVEITPVEYRPSVGLFTRTLGFLLGVYAVHQASKSGPASPPANNPNK